MKQLKRKVFTVLTAILTLAGFLAAAFSFTMQVMELEGSIQSDLVKLNASMATLYSQYRDGRRDSDSSSGLGISMNDEFFLSGDEPVYTIILSPWNTVENILYLNADQNQVDQAISEAAQLLDEEHIEPRSRSVSLLTSRYAWIYSSDRTFTMIDVRGFQKQLASFGFYCLLIYGLYVAAVLIVAALLTRWMIHPIEETFEKQKNFIADASHELKTPLAVILSSAEAMERNPSEKWLKNIETEAERMNRLITDLLELTRSEQTKLQLSAVDLTYLTEKECMIQEARIFEKGLQLDTQIAENLVAVCNADSAAQVLSILLDNAISHAASRIVVRAFRKQNRILIQVANNGNPIPPDKIGRIFERFYREDSSRNRSENRYGLGLAIAKALMEQNGGSISVFSNPEETWFQMEFRSANGSRTPEIKGQ